MLIPNVVEIERGLANFAGLATSSSLFCRLFVKKIIDMPRGQSSDQSSGKSLVSFAPSSNCYLVSVSYPWRSYLRWHSALHGPSTSPCALLPELQRYMDTVGCPRVPSRTTDLDLKNTLFQLSLIEKQWRIELVTRSGTFSEINGANEVLLFERNTFLVIAHAERKPHRDQHRFEKISNIIKQFKLSCSKLASQFTVSVFWLAL